MASKLSQVLAIASGKKSQAEKKITEAYQLLQKPALLEGLSRTYQPLADDGEKLPAETKRLQNRVREINRDVRRALTDLFDVTLTQDTANCQARADIRVEGRLIREEVPVTSLLFLEKRLTDLATYVEKIPTLDPAHTWLFDEGQDCYATEPVQTARSKKVSKPLVKYEATKEHPAQVDLVTEDVLTGYWTNRQYSGAIPAKERNEMLDRVRKLLEAIKIAREDANSIEVKEHSIGDAIFDYVFGSK